METRLARTLTKEDFSHSIAPMREALDTLAQKLSDLTQQTNFLRNIIWLLLALNAVALLLLVLLLLKVR